MSFSSRTRRSAVLLMSGAAIGACGGYAVSASGASTRAPASGAHTSAAAGRTVHAKGGLARLKRAVSITAVLPGRDGKFSTVSIDRGTLTSIDGQDLTLREGTRRATYKTVSIAVGTEATVRLSRQPSTLGALVAGDRVTVVKAPHKTAVAARPAGSLKSVGPATGATPGT